MIVLPAADQGGRATRRVLKIAGLNLVSTMVVKETECDERPRTGVYLSCSRRPYNPKVDTRRIKMRVPKLREIVARVLLYSAILVWLGCSFLFEHYSRTRPTVANRAEGRVYAQNDHGYHTYLTAKEHYLVMALMVTAGGLALTGSLVDPERRMWQWRARH